MARMVSYSVSLDTNPRIGTLVIRVISKVSTASAGRSAVAVYDYTVEPILFNPMRDLRSERNAMLFFSGLVAGHLGRDRESTVSITSPMAAYAYQVFMGGRQTRGVHIYAEFEVVLGSAGFADGGALVLDSPPFEEDYDSDEILLSFGRSSGGMSEVEISLLKKETQSGGGGGGGTCSVCLDEFSDGHVITPLSPCHHRFHAVCIATWLRKNRTCPVCRERCIIF